MVQRWLGAAAVAAIVAAVAAAVPGTARAGGPALVTLRVMTFNIFYGGDEWNLRTRDWCTDPTGGCEPTFRQVIRTIRRADADIVGLQEPTSNTRRVARALGWHADVRNAVVSRFRLIDPSGAGGEYVYARVRPGRVVAVANTHLPATPYGPYAVRDGASRREVLAMERSVRLPALRPHLRALRGLIAAGVPAFMTGDFNSPSHLDWTPAIAAARDVVRYPVRWPVGRALARIGMRDSYREAHPDPVAVRGHTWTPGGLESVPNEVHDRIDWVLRTAGATTLRSRLVGEPGGRDVAVAVDPYPSDHRGVVSTFSVDASEPRRFVAVRDRLVGVGQRVHVRYHRRPAGTPGRIVLVRAGRPPGRALATRAVDGAADGTVTFGTSGRAPRAHDVLLVDAAGRVRARTRVWLRRRGADPVITTGRRVYRRGEPIGVRWRNGPGMKFDWVGLYRVDRGHPTIGARCDSGVCGNANYLGFAYVDAAPGGSLRFGADDTGQWPLRPGRYELRLLVDDGYRAVARTAPFRVVPR